MTKDYLFVQIREMPYFRGLLRAVEARFYQDIELPAPTLDVGCGDGHFASRTFTRPLEVGLDPWHAPIHEAQHFDAYRLLTEADGGRMPFPDAAFASAVSNSVLEHIPHVESVLAETARVLKTGGVFIFCVPSHNFLPQLSVARFFDKIGLKPLARAYRDFFNRISRHHHCDDETVWQKRLEAAGFRLERYWHYFSPRALSALEWGHYFGLPSLILKKLTGRWNLVGARWNFAPLMSMLRRYYDEPVPQPEGAYTFYIARRV
jgi:SAM-dependent methyltransferase